MAGTFPPPALSPTATHLAVARPDATLDLFILPSFSRETLPPPSVLTPTALTFSSSRPILGTSSGALYLSAQPLPSLPGSVSALAATSTHLLAVGGPARTLLLLSLSSSTPLASTSLLANHRTPVSALALAPDLSRAAVCSQAVTLVNPRTGLLLRSYTGHPSPVSTAIFLPSCTRLLTASAADRYISVWDADPSSRPRPDSSVKRRRKNISAPVFPPLATLLAPENGVTTLAADAHESTGASVAAVLASGHVAVWRNWTEKGKGPAPVNCSFLVKNAPPGGKHVPVLAIAFSKVGVLDIVYGSALKPTVFSVKLAEVEDEIVLPPCATDVLVTKASQQRKTRKAKGVEGSSVPAMQQAEEQDVNGGSIDEAADDGDTEDIDDGKRDHEDDDDDDEPSIQQKLLALGISQGDPHVAAVGGFPKPGGDKSILGSRVNVLMQAIRAQDQSLFDETIEKMKDLKLIRTTVERLPQSVAAEDLLDMLVDRLQRYPTKADKLVRWIREVLMEHTGALMSQKRNKALVALVEIVNERTQALEGLSRLQGRLELVVTRAEKMKRAGTTMTGDAVPKAEYEEEEGSEDDSEESNDESTDESDSEAGSDDAEDETGELDSEQSSSEDESDSEMEDVAERVPEKKPRESGGTTKLNGHGPTGKVSGSGSSSEDSSEEGD